MGTLYWSSVFLVFIYLVNTATTIIPIHSSYLGDDPHFAVLLPSGVFLCYSIQGEHDKVFNLISNPDVHINALFIPDAKREEVTWIGSLGIVTHPRHSGCGNQTRISFSIHNSSVTVTNLPGEGSKTVSWKSTEITALSISNCKINIALRSDHVKHPIVEVALHDIKLNFAVKFQNSHLDIFWHAVGEQPELSHGLIGQFFHEGVEIDEVRKMLIIPHKEPVPIMRKPIYSTFECSTEYNIKYYTMIYCISIRLSWQHYVCVCVCVYIYLSIYNYIYDNY